MNQRLQTVLRELSPAGRSLVGYCRSHILRCRDRWTSPVVAERSMKSRSRNHVLSNGASLSPSARLPHSEPQSQPAGVWRPAIFAGFNVGCPERSRSGVSPLRNAADAASTSGQCRGREWRADFACRPCRLDRLLRPKHFVAGRRPDDRQEQPCRVADMPGGFVATHICTG